MKKIKLCLFTIITIAIMQSCSTKSEAGYYKGYEIPSYEVIKRVGDIEFRKYEPTLVAEVEVNGDRKEAAKEGFMTLARYIFGKNIAEKKVAMTSPVSQVDVSEKVAMTSPVNQINEPEIYKSKNLTGKISLFQNCIPHYTDIHNGKKERITIAFDLHVNENVLKENKNLLQLY